MSERRSLRKGPLVPALIAVAALVALVFALPWKTGGADDAPVTVTATEQADTGLAELARRQPDDPMALGDVDAPVVMVEYSEFQCPFCGRFARDTAPQLIRDYVDEGVLRIEFRDFPYLGDESVLAARAARAAAAQDRFWDFHDALFDDQPPPNSGRLDRARLLGIATGLDLDLDRFEADLDSSEVAAAIQRDRDEAIEIGVTGTPAFLVNDRVVIGAQPVEAFVETVEAAAKDARD